MSLEFAYRDPFLKSLVSDQNETDAIASVKTMGTFSDTDLETLSILKAYILCCRDSVKAPDDLFSTKLKLFQKDFDTALAIARTKTPTGIPRLQFSIAIERA